MTQLADECKQDLDSFLDTIVNNNINKITAGGNISINLSSSNIKFVEKFTATIYTQRSLH